MIAADYRDAWPIITSWNAGAVHQRVLESAKDADRLPFVTIALIRIAALLAHASEVDRDFTQQLVYANDSNMITRILKVTDQILSAIDAEQASLAGRLTNELDVIPEHLVFRDAVSAEVEVDA
ncbi:hypothetical protein [Mycolicibacterium tusciae]|uniref:hypothetical protein n=1 Tax=Mycolicibacterium tusciae TaxID=75922 RepID=UPI00024A31F2|nr:hypothetical protein [Mycolicibacterium tusciae]